MEIEDLGKDVTQAHFYTRNFMVNSIAASEPAPLRAGIKAPVKETLLTPRFYTTDFDRVAQMDLSGQTEELAAIVAELRTDYNRYHFVRNEEFNQCWDKLFYI